MNRDFLESWFGLYFVIAIVMAIFILGFLSLVAFVLWDWAGLIEILAEGKWFIIRFWLLFTTGYFIKMKIEGI